LVHIDKYYLSRLVTVNAGNTSYLFDMKEGPKKIRCYCYFISD